MIASNNNINFSNFNLLKATPHILVVRILINEIVLCAFNNTNGAINLLLHFSWQPNGNDSIALNKIFDTCKQINIYHTCIAIDDIRFDVVPNAFKDLELINTQFNYRHHLENDEQIKIQTLAWQEFFGVFAIKNQTINLFNTDLKRPQFVNTYLCLLDGYTKSLVTNINEIFLCIQQNHLIITVYEKGKLILHNSALYFGLDDALYQVQKNIEILKIKNQNIYICGPESAAVFELLQKHYGNIEYCKIPEAFIHPKEWTAVNQANIYPLIAIANYANY